MRNSHQSKGAVMKPKIYLFVGALAIVLGIIYMMRSAEEASETIQAKDQVEASSNVQLKEKEAGAEGEETKKEEKQEGQ